MSLGVIVKAPVGLVLAAESRITLAGQFPGGTAVQVNYDNASKVFDFQPPHDWIGVVTWGLAVLENRTAQSHLPAFTNALGKERIPVLEFAKKLSEFFMDRWSEANLPDSGPPMTFAVGGFDEDDPYGKVYIMDIPHSPQPEERSKNQFGYTWGGQGNFVERITRGYESAVLGTVAEKFGFGIDEPKMKELIEALGPLQMPIPLEAMPLQDCVDLAIFFIRSTITAQSLSVGTRGCGGALDVATITALEPLNFIQRKRIIGEDTGGRFSGKE